MRSFSRSKRRIEPWFITVVLAALLPLLPEYIAPFLGVGTLVCAYRDARRHQRVFTIGPLGKLMLIYLLFLAVGILYSHNAMSAFTSWLMWAAMLTVYVALHTVLIDRRRMDVALFGVSVAAGGVGGIACVQYFLRIACGFTGHLQLWYPLDSLVYRLSPVGINMEVVGNRACSTFTNPNIMAEYLVAVIPFVALYAFGHRRSRTRMIARGCLILAVGGVFFSFSRGCYLALLAIGCVFAVANLRRLWLAFLSGFAVVALTPQAVIERLFSIQKVKRSVAPPPMATATQTAAAMAAVGADKAINERFQVWHACLQSFFDHPLLGIGAGTGNTNAMLLSHGLNVPHAHNIVLQLLVEGGIVGLGIFAVAGFKALQTGVRLTRRSGESRRSGVAIMAFLAAFCVSGMVEFPLFTPKLVGIFLLALALVDGAGRLYLAQPACALVDVVVPPLHRRLSDQVSAARMK